MRPLAARNWVSECWMFLDTDKNTSKHFTYFVYDHSTHEKVYSAGLRYPKVMRFVCGHRRDNLNNYIISLNEHSYAFIRRPDGSNRCI